MLVFIIPVKNKKISRSWDLLSKLFERCLKSLCNQTSPNFRVVVVCNEKPDTQFDHPHIHYVNVDFPPPISESDEPENSTGYAYGQSQKINKQNADKARRIAKGLEYAERFNPSYFMVVDADDCVNRHLSEFVEQHQDVDGWLLKKGYVYREGSKLLWLNRKTFNEVCGTSLIMKYSWRNALFPRPDFYNHLFKQIPGANVKQLPFVGAIYSIGNGENIYMGSHTQTAIKKQVFQGGILVFLQKALKYRLSWLTKSLINDFSLYTVSG
ncbi:glycosyltransferase family A protein [Merismopedia glauca]|uniref:Glycosyltransferase family 2 protein n=1 Tax=Merismopedia glauca CCAP 1448/3 TaxID=1296344 RepID=A0A2T1BZE2_9CYAN|nr:glycosyltransferase family A protein [Merismopedia glauca]PSB01243.1 glycosyltransferase family 2 protein [Merismopedia glauca CCAP 1448/3]